MPSPSGFAVTIAAALIPAEEADKLLASLVELGAVDVKELAREDWESTGGWKALRPLQSRRLLQHLSRPTHS